MKLIKNFSEKRHKQLQKFNIDLDIKRKSFLNAIEEMNGFLISENEFLDLIEAEEIIKKYDKLFTEENKKVKKRYKKFNIIESI